MYKKIKRTYENLRKKWKMKMLSQKKKMKKLNKNIHDVLVNNLTEDTRRATEDKKELKLGHSKMTFVVNGKAKQKLTKQVLFEDRQHIKDDKDKIVNFFKFIN